MTSFGTPIPEGYVPLTIELMQNPNFTLDGFPMPEPERITLDSLNETFNIASGEIVLKSTIRTSPRPQAGETTLAFEMHFQSCNDTLCFPPDTFKFRFPVTITRN
jgi:hypothetical protein